MDETIPNLNNLPSSDSIYQSVVEQQTELICRRSPDGVLTFVNEAYCLYFGYPRDELVGRRYMPLIPEEDRRKIDRISETLTVENPAVVYEHRTLSKPPEARWLQWTKKGIYDSDGQLLEFQFVGRDITTQKKKEEELRYFATHDMVTRLYNLSFFHTEMERLEQSRMFPISILLCLVEFSDPSETNQAVTIHERIYQQTAHLMRVTFRAEDIIARIQEGLFGVLLPSTSIEGARRGIDRLGKCLQTQKRLDGDGVNYRLGCATGEKGIVLNDLLRQSEQNLLDQPLI